jgi:hypothetical protein
MDRFNTGMQSEIQFAEMIGDFSLALDLITIKFRVNQSFDQRRRNAGA